MELHENWQYTTKAGLILLGCSVVGGLWQFIPAGTVLGELRPIGIAICFFAIGVLTSRYLPIWALSTEYRQTWQNLETDMARPGSPTKASVNANALDRPQALHDLICSMPRGPHTRSMRADELVHYIYKAGVALHNLPFELGADSVIEEYHFHEINELDPDGSANHWGPWAKQFAFKCGVELPSRPGVTGRA